MPSVQNIVYPSTFVTRFHLQTVVEIITHHQQTVFAKILETELSYMYGASSRRSYFASENLIFFGKMWFCKVNQRQISSRRVCFIQNQPLYNLYYIYCSNLLNLRRLHVCICAAFQMYESRLFLNRFQLIKCFC